MDAGNQPAARLAAGLLAAAAVAGPAAGQPVDYALDPTHSSVTFEVLHFDTATIRGRFSLLEGTVQWDRGTGRGRVQVVVDTASVSTGVPVLDALLRRDDLLASSAHPRAYFVAEQFSAGTDGAVQAVTGEFSVNADQLLGAIAPVRGAMAHNDVRFYLNGLCIDLSALGTARLVATDGHRLHFIDTPIDEQARQSKLSELLLADTSIAHLAKLLQLGGDCKVQVLGERMVRVALGATTFTSKLIESKYADYKRILSEVPDRQIEVSRDDLRQALQRMRAVLFDARVHAVRLDMDGADLRISVSGTGDEGEESITAVSSIASDFHANVTLPYLMEAVEACPGEAVRIAPTRTDGPIHILPTSSTSSPRSRR